MARERCEPESPPLVYRPQRYTRVVEWDLSQKDLTPVGTPEVGIRYRAEYHLGLVVYGQWGVPLGILGVRCDAQGWPISAAIPD